MALLSIDILITSLNIFSQDEPIVSWATFLKGYSIFTEISHSLILFEGMALRRSIYCTLGGCWLIHSSTAYDNCEMRLAKRVFLIWKLLPYEGGPPTLLHQTSTKILTLLSMAPSPRYCVKIRRA